MSNSTLYLAIYGSIISTIAVTWNIILYVRSKKGKLRITPTSNTKVPVTHSGTRMKSFTSLDISVVNLSEKTRYIKQPQFELDQRDNKYMNILDLENPVKYPVQLNPGEEFSVWFNIDNLNNGSLDKIVAKKFKVRIIDTHGKEHKSKWYNTKDFYLIK